MNGARRTVGAVLRGLKALQAAWVVLYAFTLALHLSAAFARWMIGSISLSIVAWITGWPIPVSTIALVVAFAPLLASLLAVICPPLIAPIEGRWWEISSGGRPPEQDEREAFEHAIAALQEDDPDLRPPRHWFVREDPGHNAAVYSSSISTDRGLLEDPIDVPPVLAHELSHLNSSDGKLSSALKLLVILPTETPRIRPLWSLPFRGLFWIASGTAPMLLLGNSWEMYWRSREFAADHYAATLGQGPALAMTLELDSLPYERPIPRMMFSRASHPYTKPRIARLLAYTDHQEPLQRPGANHR